MFGGLTHEPAARLAELLVEITPDGLRHGVPRRLRLGVGRGRDQDGAAVPARPSGGRSKHRLMTWRGGYHGDTFAPMSVCDPDGGMHSHVDRRAARGRCSPRALPPDYDPAYVADLRSDSWHEHADELAAVIVEPVVQGAGGMRFHDPALPDATCAGICDEHGRAADLRRDRHRVRSHR